MTVFFQRALKYIECDCLTLHRTVKKPYTRLGGATSCKKTKIALFRIYCTCSMQTLPLTKKTKNTKTKADIQRKLLAVVKPLINMYLHELLQQINIMREFTNLQLS